MSSIISLECTITASTWSSLADIEGVSELPRARVSVLAVDNEPAAVDGEADALVHNQPIAACGRVVITTPAVVAPKFCVWQDQEAGIGFYPNRHVQYSGILQLRKSCSSMKFLSLSFRDWPDAENV
ncbi:hypothetical protein NDU88_005743 [Pleurodeles waltl]|uniref:Uncharacterized protein n=1 Tax=Pleurodeles waltl TaxID=8319 RepID=A0AAV7SMR4_PLEWA|nr:hypothetical protein NDU88_005743 [Pleurodeles waltl]